MAELSPTRRRLGVVLVVALFVVGPVIAGFYPSPTVVVVAGIASGLLLLLGLFLVLRVRR